MKKNIFVNFVQFCAQCVLLNLPSYDLILHVEKNNLHNFAQNLHNFANSCKMCFSHRTFDFGHFFRKILQKFAKFCKNFSENFSKMWTKFYQKIWCFSHQTWDFGRNFLDNFENFEIFRKLKIFRNFIFFKIRVYIRFFDD